MTDYAKLAEGKPEEKPVVDENTQRRLDRLRKRAEDEAAKKKATATKKRRKFFDQL